jgi:Fe-S-cluster-containing hydrogenase component 2
LILAKLINPRRLRVRYRREKCICSKDPDPCREACSLSLNPKTLATFWETECNNCGDCVVTCNIIFYLTFNK